MVRRCPPSASEIRELLTDKRPLVRFAGALVLDQAPLTSPELVPLIAPIADDPEGIARLRGVWALGKIGTPQALEVLKGVASGSAESRQRRAARSLLERLK